MHKHMQPGSTVLKHFRYARLFVSCPCELGTLCPSARNYHLVLCGSNVRGRLRASDLSHFFPHSSSNTNALGSTQQDFLGETQESYIITWPLSLPFTVSPARPSENNTVSSFSGIQ